MPNHKSAWKRMRQNECKRLRNKAQRSYLRKAIKSFKVLDETDSARDQFPKVASVIDKAAKKGIIHRRNAARLKSRLSVKTAGS
ncbi:MAG: 30S ribosomal protein S20 [Candidatus Krumholzibacteria bacterium]|nr:30S ribosomal protein S20 [Candidatus Krumholzibacteria bacterium]